jgi:adenine-specific DNA-methyltransferase
MPPPRENQPSGPTPVEAFKHEDKRVNIPTADSSELVSPAVSQPKQLRYKRNPDLDPQLVWTGKDEQDGEDLVVDAPPVYIQEKIVPQVIIENLRKVIEKPELTLFDDYDGLQGYEAVEYYQHEANWSNRMILGDSLQVMASLAEKENLRGKVQMVYIDPPYGIKFNSNWQVKTDDREVTDGRVDSLTREVEQIKAFRDTWANGISSYLAYLRDRLIIARDLLAESGSVFVQIGDENVHLTRSLLDEVFGSENFVSIITTQKTSSSTGNFIGGVTDYVVWYGKNIEELKFRKLYQIKEYGGAGASNYTRVRLPGGATRSLSKEEQRSPDNLPARSRVYAPDNLTSQSMGRAKGEGAASWFRVELPGQPKPFDPGPRARWKTNTEGMERLILADRVEPTDRGRLAYIRYFDDFPAFPLSNIWTDTVSSFMSDKIFIVQTNTKIIERCMLMTTDPGDLVIDPTCGSGTTAFVAEQWGRRWITMDTSRVALVLARQRIMGSRFPFYELADPSGDVRKAFVYKRIPHITLKSIATNPDIKAGMTRAQIDAAIARHADSETLYDQPQEDRRKVRVSGPFTVESLSPHSTVASVHSESEKTATADDGSAFEKSIIDNLLKAGVQNGRKAERLLFDSLAPFAGERIQGEGIQRDTGQRVAVSIGPQFGTVDAEWIRLAAREATRGLGFDMLLVCAFAFDPQANESVKEFSIGRVRVVLVRMNSDLAMGDVLLKKTGSGNLFTIFGEPDIEITEDGDELTVEIRGVDVYNPTTGEIRSSGTGEIALWMIDTDYDGESFFVRHCYFTGDNDPYKRLKAALKADIDLDAWESLYQTRSRPFKRPESGKIAVKVVNHYGDEVLQVYDV